MRPVRPRLLALSLPLLLVLAGCTSPAPTQEGEDELVASEPISAKVATGSALDWARANWAEDAKVLLASAIEAGPESQGLQAAQRAQTTAYPLVADEDLGDGKVALWLVNLWSPAEGETRTLAITAGGNKVFDHDGRAPSSTPSPVTGWTVDSPGALAVAMEAPGFREVAAAEDGTIFHTLGIREGTPVWQLRAYSPSASVNTWEFVDATTGASWTQSDRLSARHSHFGGNVTLEQPNASRELPLPEGYHEIEMRISWNATGPNGTVDLGIQLTANGTELTPAEGPVTEPGRFEATYKNLTRPPVVSVVLHEPAGRERVDYTVDLLIKEGA